VELRFISGFPNRNRSPSSLNKLLMKIVQSGTEDCKPDSGKKRKMRISQNVDSVKELVLSQRNAPGTHKTIRHIQKTPKT